MRSNCRCTGLRETNSATLRLGAYQCQSHAFSRRSAIRIISRFRKPQELRRIRITGTRYAYSAYKGFTYSSLANPPAFGDRLS